jgi:hypothetical protein
MHLRFASMLVCVALLGACGKVNVDHSESDAKASVGPMIHETRDVEVGKAEMAGVELQFGAGELTVVGGGPKLMSATFDYNVAAWKPVINYDATGFRGHLVVNQGAGSSGIGDAKNEWRIQLANDTPIDLTVKCGAGKGRLDLHELNLRSVSVHMGAGEVEMDLRGHPRKDYEVLVRGGVGEARILLPKDVGVIAEAKGGLGEVDAPGLTKRDDSYVNEAYGRSKTTIHVDVKGGIGKIALISD